MLFASVCVALLAACAIPSSVTLVEDGVAKVTLWTYLDRIGLGEITNRVSVFTTKEGRLAKATHPDAFAIWTENGRISIAGRTEEAAKFGVWAFLEDFCGCRFFHAGKGGEVLPPKGSVKLPEAIDLVRTPAVGNRHINWWYASVEPDMKSANYKRWLEQRGFDLDEPCGGQTALGEVTKAHPFEKNPEFYPLRRGVRDKAVGDKIRQRCYSDATFRKLYADRVYAHLCERDDFMLDFYSESNGDCECESCRKYGMGDDGVYLARNAQLRFMADVSRDVLSRGDFRGLRVFLFHDWRFPPTASDIRFDSRLSGVYSPIPRCYAHGLEAPCNSGFLSDIRAFGKHGLKPGVFEWMCVTGVRYAPLAQVLADDVRLLAREGMSAWLDNNTSGSEPMSYALANWETYYVLSKVLWDPSLDTEALLDDAYTRYYGKAAGPMKAYQALRRKLWAAAPGHACAGPYNRPSFTLLDPKDAEALEKLLAEGEQLAVGDEALATRIAADRRGLETFWLKPSCKTAERLAGRKALPTAAFRVRDFPTEAEWAQVPATAMISDRNPTNVLPEATSVRVVAGTDAWYVRFDGEMKGEPVAKATKRDADLWFDDTYELAVSPPDGGYFLLMVNTLGTVFDSEGAAGTYFDAGLETRMTRKDGRWIVDLKVPAKRMHAAGLVPGEKWGFVFCRDNPRTNDGGAVDGTNAHDVTRARLAIVP